MMLGYWHHGASNDNEVTPIIYIHYTSKFDKQLSIDSLFCFSRCRESPSDADADNYATTLTPLHQQRHWHHDNHLHKLNIKNDATLVMTPAL